MQGEFALWDALHMRPGCSLNLHLVGHKEESLKDRKQLLLKEQSRRGGSWGGGDTLILHKSFLERHLKPEEYPVSHLTLKGASKSV